MLAGEFESKVRDVYEPDEAIAICSDFQRRSVSEGDHDTLLYVTAKKRKEESYADPVVNIEALTIYDSLSSNSNAVLIRSLATTKAACTTKSIHRFGSPETKKLISGTKFDVANDQDLKKELIMRFSEALRILAGAHLTEKDIIKLAATARVDEETNVAFAAAAAGLANEMTEKDELTKGLDILQNISEHMATDWRFIDECIRMNKIVRGELDKNSETTNYKIVMNCTAIKHWDSIISG